VRRLYPDYDRVAIVNFDFKSHPVTITDTKPLVETTSQTFSYIRDIRNPDPNGLNQGSGLCSDPNTPPNYHGECDDDPNLAGSQSTGIFQAIDSVKLNYDKKPWVELSSVSPDTNTWLMSWGKWNPLDARCNWTTWTDPALCPGHPLGNVSPDPYGSYSYLSTCSGCGIRVAGNMLKLSGRPSALWIIVFLSDGGVNASDVPGTATDAFFNPGINPNYYPNGYCGVLSTTVNLNNPVSLWQDSCVNKTFSSTTRLCGPYNESQGSCPPGATYVGPNSPPYDALDYARDMIDTAALRVNCIAGPTEDCLANNGGTSTKYNKNEHPRGATGPAGASVAIYSIGLGAGVASGDAQAFLRYMAAVGDDGDRATDPCVGVVDATSCGNFYYARGGGNLAPIFEDIAKRVFTRLSK